jgi:hypothetical protein
VGFKLYSISTGEDEEEDGENVNYLVDEDGHYLVSGNGNYLAERGGQVVAVNDEGEEVEDDTVDPAMLETGYNVRNIKVEDGVIMVRWVLGRWRRDRM